MIKIKIVREKKSSLVQNSAGAKRRQLGVGSMARVRHCLAEGLWEFEGEDGQTYLAVKAKPWRPNWTGAYTSDVDLPPVPPPISHLGRPRAS